MPMKSKLVMSCHLLSTNNMHKTKHPTNRTENKYERAFKSFLQTEFCVQRKNRENNMKSKNDENERSVKNSFPFGSSPLTRLILRWLENVVIVMIAFCWKVPEWRRKMPEKREYEMKENHSIENDNDSLSTYIAFWWMFGIPFCLILFCFLLYFHLPHLCNGFFRFDISL